MLSPFEGVHTPDLQQRVNDVYGLWAPDHADGHLLTVRGYDPDEIYQRVEISRIDPEPDIEMATVLGMAGMGEVGFNKLSSSFQDNKVIERSFDRHKKSLSTLIPTLHAKNVLDTAMTHNNLFVASGGDPEFAEINDIISNPMMSRLTIGGMAVYRALTSAGGIDNAVPIEAAVDYGMSNEDAQLLERFYAPTLIERLKTGSVFHWSLPGTRGKKIVTKKQEEATYIKRVHDGIANIARKRLSWAVPVVMDVNYGDTKAEVLEARRLESIDDVHKMMAEMADAGTELSGEKIFYGMPEGAQLLED